jgi:hypothetical protein
LLGLATALGCLFGRPFRLLGADLFFFLFSQGAPSLGKRSHTYGTGEVQRAVRVVAGSKVIGLKWTLHDRCDIGGVSYREGCLLYTPVRQNPY